MAGELERLLIRLEADTTILRRALEQAEKSVDGFGSKVNRSLTSIDRRTANFSKEMGRSFSAIAGYMAAAFGAQALNAQLQATAQLGGMATAAGLTVEQFGALRRAAIESGASVDTFDKASQKFAITMGELRARSGGFYEFLQKHLPTLDSQLRKTNNQADAFRVLMDQVASLSRAEDKAALIKAALGDEAVKLAGLLGQGSGAMTKATDDALKYAAIIDERAVKSSQDFKKEVDLLSNELGVRFSNALGEAASALTPLVTGLREFFAEVDKQRYAQAASLGMFDKLTDKQLLVALDTIKKEMQEMQAAADRAAKSPSFWESWLGQSDKYARAAEQMREQLAAIEKEMAGRKVAGQLRGASAEPGTPVAAVPGMADRLQAKPLPPWQTTTDFSGVDAMSRVREQGTTDPLERIRIQQEQELESFRRLLADKKIDETEYAEARDAINRASSVKIMDALKQEADLQRAKFAEVEAAISGPLTTAIDGLFATGKINAQAFFASVLSGLAQVATQAMIVKPLMDAIFAGATGGLGGGGLLSSIGGLFGFAHGGPTIGGRPVMVGERGPEIFVPSTSGRVMNGAQMGRMANAGQTINMPITITGDATDATVERFRRVAQQEIARNAPGIVNASVSRVADTHRRDPSYLRR